MKDKYSPMKHRREYCFDDPIDTRITASPRRKRQVYEDKDLAPLDKCDHEADYKTPVGVRAEG